MSPGRTEREMFERAAWPQRGGADTERERDPLEVEAKKVRNASD